MGVLGNRDTKVMAFVIYVVRSMYGWPILGHTYLYKDYLVLLYSVTLLFDSSITYEKLEFCYLIFCITMGTSHLLSKEFVHF